MDSLCGGSECVTASLGGRAAGSLPVQGWDPMDGEEREARMNGGVGRVRGGELHGLTFEAAGIVRPTVEMRMAVFLSGIPDATSESFHDELGVIVDFNTKWGAPSDSDEVLTYAVACCFLKHLRRMEAQEKARSVGSTRAMGMVATGTGASVGVGSSSSRKGVQGRCDRAGVSEFAREDAVIRTLCRATHRAGRAMDELYGPIGFHACDGKESRQWRARVPPKGWCWCPMCRLELCGGCSVKCPGCPSAMCKPCAAECRRVFVGQRGTKGPRCACCNSLLPSTRGEWAQSMMP